MLAGCSSIDERQARVRNVLNGGSETASGVVAVFKEKWNVVWGMAKRIVTFGQNAVADVQRSVEGIEQRVQKVQDGVEKIQEGKNLLEEGLQRD